MLELYRRKFSVEDIVRVTYSLCYFDDAESNPMPAMLQDIDWEEAKATIRTWVKSIVALGSIILLGRLPMSFVLQPWQLFFLILASWINRQQQEVIELFAD